MEAAFAAEVRKVKFVDILPRMVHLAVVEAPVMDEPRHAGKGDGTIRLVHELE